MTEQPPLSPAPPACDDSADLIVHLARLAQSGPTASRLSAAQWTALRYFARANQFSRTPSAFSEFHATTRGTASQTIRSLVDIGLLRRAAHGSDGRSTLIEVTEAGQQVLNADPMADLRTVLANLPQDMRATLTQALQTAIGALAARRNAPIFGTCSDCSHCDERADAAFCHCTQTWLAAPDMSSLCVDFRPHRAGPPD